MDEKNEIVDACVLSAKIGEYRDKVDKAIFAELNNYRDSTFFLPLKRAIEGGKRLRPILLILACESVSGQNVNVAFPAAVAVELTHLESLIHDDIIDKDSLRRETAAFHSSHGQEMALLSADFILSIILDITARYNDKRIAQSLAQAAASMCEGQLEELKAYKNRKTLTLNEYVCIISKKTASLFEASVEIGALIGGARKDELQALSRYGQLLGIAYQIEDDVADLAKVAKINLLNLLKTDSDKIVWLHEKSNECILEAKQKIVKLRNSNARSLLLELADFAISPSIARF